ncbi:unnamed protein product [Calypogeia fissa]
MTGSLRKIGSKFVRFAHTFTCTSLLFYVLVGVPIFGELFLRTFLVQKHPFRQLPDGDLVRCIPIQNLMQRLPVPTPITWQTAPAMEPLDRNFPQVSKVHSIREATQLITSESKPVCPIGSVPIRSTPTIFDFTGLFGRKVYPKMMNSVVHLLVLDHKVKSSTPSDSALWSNCDGTHKYAVTNIVGPYRGTQGRLSIWQPHVQDEEFSLAQVWVSSTDIYGKLHTLEAGWQIYRGLYSDSKPRLFVYWTADRYLNTGCYNLECPGFIQVSNKWLLGGSFEEISSLDSDFVYEIKIHIFKDRRTGDWWLQLNGDNMGYWPKSLFGPGAFSDLNTIIHWGGEIWHRPGMYTDTQMGNGNHPSSSGSQRVAYVRNLQVVNCLDSLVDPLRSPALSLLADYRACCDVKVHESWSNRSHRSSWGTYAYFGGPGFNADCVGVH